MNPVSLLPHLVSNGHTYKFHTKTKTVAADTVEKALVPKSAETKERGILLLIIKLN